MSPAGLQNAGRFLLFGLPETQTGLTLARVRKLVLGKGLRTLLNGTPVPGESRNPRATLESGTEPSLSPGVETLLRGEGKAPAEESQATPPDTARMRHWRSWSLTKWVLLAADFMLLTLASLLVIKNPGALSFSESVLCLTALALGAALALLAILGIKNR